MLLATGLGSVMAAPALADTIVLKSGDRITGQIVSADGGKVVVTPDFDKSVKVTLAQGDIATFSTTAPVRLKLKSGETIDQPVAEGSPGEIAAAPSAGAPVQSIPVATIDKINPPVGPVWTGTVGVNGLYSHAGTDDLTLGLSANTSRRDDLTRITLSGAYNYGEQKDNGVSSTSANNWFVQGEYDYFFSKKLFGYVSARAEADQVNFLTLRVTPGAGAGYQWIDTPALHFSTQGGASWIYEDYKTNPKATERAAINLAYHVDKAWDSGRLTAFHDLTLLPALEGGEFLVQGDAGFRVALTKSMYSEVKANATYDNQPAPGARDLTTQVTIGLGLSY